jgi:hypothetical protein
MNRRDLLAILPPDKGKEETIVGDQDVDDIMQEVLDAHQKFRKDYDRIAGQFAQGPVEKRLYDWCRQNLRYIVESIQLQTTTSPTVLMQRGYCDCKGYAGFIAGVLDALNRKYKGHYDWCFRFGVYENLYEHNWHVFVVVRHPDGSDTWIDPVLEGFNRRNPAPDYYQDEIVPPAPVTMAGPAAPGPPILKSNQVLAGYIGQLNTTINLNPTPPPTTPTASGPSATPQMSFKEAGSGILLPSIPGYPPDLPQLQLTASGRLCFWNWPLWLTSPLWIDLKYVTPQTPTPSISQPFSTLDWEGTYLRLMTKTNLGTGPTAAAAAKALHDGFVNGQYLWNYTPYWSGATYYWDERRPWQWIMENIQYYINKYLKNPYKITQLIPYGTNWNDQFKAAIQGGAGKLQTYLEGCNFLVQPVGTQGFWDKFYQAAPLLITAAATIISAGAAAPALAAAIASFAIKAGQSQQAAAAAAANPVQGAPVYNVPAIEADIAPPAATTTGSGILSWIQANPLPAFGIAALIVLGIYEMSKE